MATRTKRRDDGKIRPSELEGTDLGTHDGLPITQSAAKVTKTGDGLSEAMGMAKFHVPVLSEGVLIVPVKVVSHEYDRVTVQLKGEGKTPIEEFVETTVYEARGAFLADPDLVDELTAEYFGRVADHRARVAQEKRAAKGELPMPNLGVVQGEGATSE